MAGVTIVQVAVARRAPASARRARGAEAGDAAAVGVYAGMAPAELAAVLRLALQLPPSASFSAFAVSEAAAARGVGGKKPRRRAQANGELQNGVGGVRRRIVPLSLACRSPELLRGSDGRGVAELIVTTEAADAQEGERTAALGAKTEAVASNGSPSAGTAPAAAGASAKASERIARLVSALQQERAVSEFEGAVLAEMCEQQADEVLAVVGSSRRSLDAKKQYLLDLVKPSPAVDLSTGLDASRQHPNSRRERPVAQRFGGEPQHDAQQQVPSRPEDLHVELVFKKVMAIARSVFSPQTQSELTELAKSYRTKSTQPRSRPLDDARFTQVMELLAIVEKLLNKHALPEEQSFYLIELVLAENRMLLSALQAFKQDGGSWSELEATVTRVAALNTTGRVDASTLTSPRNGSPRKRTKNVGKTVASPRHSKHAHHHISSPPGPRPLPAPKVNGNSVASKGNSVMFTLHTKRMLTSLEYDILCALVQQDDSQVLELLADYDQQQITLLALRDALVGIVDEITTELGDEEKAAFAQGMSDAALDGQYGTGGAPQWPLQIAHMLAKWQQSGALSAEHAHVLEQMTVQRHHLLESAYEVFAGDGDESELLDTLQRVAKLQATVQQMEAQEQLEQQKQFNAVVDTQCDALGASDKLLVKQLFSRRSELVIAAWQVYEAEHNADELADTLLRIARFTTRNDTKLRLVEIVGEMMKRRLIRSHEADGLIRLFEERNEALMAANEAFEADGDVKELVETLLLVVKHANFGDPPVCSPRGSGDKSFSFDDSAAQNAESTRISKIIDQIASKGRLAVWQKSVLLSLLEAGDVRLLAAYDLYNDDRNVRELVDTLQRLADIVAWERGKQQLIDEWVVPLAASGRISSASGDLLRVLVEKRDDRVMAAFSVYLEDQNGSELRDSLARIAAIAFLQKITREKESEQVESSKMLDVVSSLIENGALESESKGTIKALVEAKDPRVLAAMDVYATTSDAADLADTLRRIIAIDSRVAAGRSPSVRMEKQLLHFVSELPLDAEQAAALKRAIAERDAEIEAAARTFLEKSDESGLKDTLLRLATRVSSTPETSGDA